MNHRDRVYEDVFEMMPGVENPTPLVRLRALAPSPDFQLYAKLEWMNPWGSVKDRAAWALLRDLEQRGELTAGRSLVEPTSGNTGISLAALAGARGSGLRAVVPNRVPLEKKILLRIAGAELDVVSDELCPAPGLGEGSINLAKTHAKAEPGRYVMPNQYENEINVLAHYHTTGPRDLAPDPRPHHSPVRLARHVRHGHRHGALPARTEGGRQGHCRSADRGPRRAGPAERESARGQQVVRRLIDR